MFMVMWIDETHIFVQASRVVVNSGATSIMALYGRRDDLMSLLVEWLRMKRRSTHQLGTFGNALNLSRPG